MNWGKMPFEYCAEESKTMDGLMTMNAIDEYGGVVYDGYDFGGQSYGPSVGVRRLENFDGAFQLIAESISHFGTVMRSMELKMERKNEEILKNLEQQGQSIEKLEKRIDDIESKVKSVAEKAEALSHKLFKSDSESNFPQATQSSPTSSPRSSSVEINVQSFSSNTPMPTCRLASNTESGVQPKSQYIIRPEENPLLLSGSTCPYIGTHNHIPFPSKQQFVVPPTVHSTREMFTSPFQHRYLSAAGSSPDNVFPNARVPPVTTAAPTPTTIKQMFTSIPPFFSSFPVSSSLSRAIDVYESAPGGNSPYAVVSTATANRKPVIPESTPVYYVSLPVPAPTLVCSFGTPESSATFQTSRTLDAPLSHWHVTPEVESATNSPSNACTPSSTSQNVPEAQVKPNSSSPVGIHSSPLVIHETDGVKSKPTAASQSVGTQSSGSQFTTSGCKASFHSGGISVLDSTPSLPPCSKVNDKENTSCPVVAPSISRQNRLILGKKLLRAAEEGNVGDVITLLDQGADMNFTHGSKWTPLHRAAKKGHANVVALLLSRGANVRARDCHGFTPLHVAVFRDVSGSCVRLLINAGSYLGSKNQSGRTPLHYAAENGNVSAVQALVDAGADKTAKDSEGKTPLDLATDYVRYILTTVRV